MRKLKLKLQLFISFWVIFLSLNSTALSQSNVRTANPGTFGFRLSSGYGQYSSLVVPEQLASIEQMSAIQASLQGLPVSLEVEKPLTSPYGLAVGGQGLFITALNGPEGRQDSSYRLWQLWTTAPSAVQRSAWQLGPKVTLQRQTFMNVSTGHNIDSLMLGMELSWKQENWSLEAEAGYGAWAQVGYNDGKSFLSKPLKKSEAKVSVFEFGGKRRLNRHAALVLETSVANSQVTINDFSSYQPYGLAQPPGFGSNLTMKSSYHLQAQSVRLGFEKQW